jgi:hypothetical protein
MDQAEQTYLLIGGPRDGDRVVIRSSERGLAFLAHDPSSPDRAVYLPVWLGEVLLYRHETLSLGRTLIWLFDRYPNYERIS